MSSYDKFILILCFIVFTLLTAVFSCMLVLLTKQSVRLIQAGAEDSRIYKKYKKASRYASNDSLGWFAVISTLFFACLTIFVFGISITLQIAEHRDKQNIPLYRVVYSESMSKKYEKNTYLFENNLDDQFSRFDLIKTLPLPKEEDLQLYDVVVYEVDDTLVVHRIVGIEEPNEEHPNERLFQLQGDYVERPDRSPVRYEQMRAIYKGEHIKHVGSFVLFLQSPAGYACLLLIIVEMIAAPLMTKRIEKEEKLRYKVIQYTGGLGGVSGIGEFAGTQYIMLDEDRYPNEGY